MTASSITLTKKKKKKSKEERKERLGPTPSSSNTLVC